MGLGLELGLETVWCEDGNEDRVKSQDEDGFGFVDGDGVRLGSGLPIRMGLGGGLGLVLSEGLELGFRDGLCLGLGRDWFRAGLGNGVGVGAEIIHGVEGGLGLG